MAEPHRSFEVHAAELAGGPRDAEQRRLERAAGHRLRAEPVSLAEHDRPERNGQVGAGDEQAGDVTDGRTSLVLGPDHESGRVAQEEHGQVEGVAQLQEACSLVGPVDIDRAAEMSGVVGDDTQWPALDPRQGRHDPRCPTPAELEHGSRGRTSRRSRHGRRTHASGSRARDGAAGPGRRRTSPPTTPVKYERYCFATVTASASSSTAMSMTPLATCTSNGPISVGSYVPRPPPSIIAGPPIAMFVPATPMTTSQQPRIAAFPAKQYPDAMPIERDQPAEPCEASGTRGMSRPETAEPVGVTRTPSTSFGEEDDGQPPTFGQLEQAVLLLVAQEALRTGEHGVVVRHRHHGTTVHRADAADEPVGRRPLDELLERAAPALRGDDERPVLHERSLVDADRRRSPARSADPRRDAERPRRCADRHECARGGRDTAARSARAAAASAAAASSSAPTVADRACGGSERQQRLPLPDCRSDRHHHLLHDTAALGGDDVLHLHRLEDCDLLSWSHDITGAYVDRDDRPLYRGRDDVRHRHVLAQRSSDHAERSTRPGAGVGHCAQGCGSSRRSWKSSSHCRSMSSVSMQSAKPA